MTTYGDYSPISRITHSALSPDGQQLAVIDGGGGSYNLFVGPVKEPLTQVTHFTDSSVRDISWHPESKLLALLSDTDGDEMYQVRILDLASGTLTDVTNQPDRQFSLYGAQWSPDGKFLAYSGNYPDPTATTVWLHELSTGAQHSVALANDRAGSATWSADSRYLGCYARTSNTIGTAMIVDRESGEHTPIMADPPGKCFLVAVTGPTTGLAVCDFDREFPAFGQFDTTTDTFTPVFAPDWGVDSFTKVRQNICWAIVNEHGYSVLHRFDVTTGESLPTPALPQGVVSGFSVSADGQRAVALVDTPTRPANNYLIDLGSDTVELISANAPRLGAQTPMVAPELVSFPAFDGHTIPAFVYRPEGPGPHPVVVSIHGGPQAQELPRYQPFYQLLLSKGIGVVAPNIRGSVGYGRTYCELIERNWGIADLKDFETVRDYVATLDWVDDDRVGVYGRSYGGFATLTCVTRLPDRWQAAVDIVGPSNLVTFCQSVPPHWRAWVKEWVGDWENDADGLYQRSPVAYVDQVQAPLMVVQGGNDPRVVQAESEAIVEAMKGAGKPVRYELYPDEGHVFTRESNEWKVYDDATDFLVEYLLP